MTELLALQALDQAAAIRRGEVSSEELTRAYLGRIAARNEALQAFVQLAPGRALAAARAFDRARQRDPDAVRSPLAGLPTGLKDLHLTRGFFTRAGSRAFRWAFSPVDDATSAAVRRAGMVVVGKTATSELGILPVVETELDPPTRNPWDPDRTAGGSSGGAAAAIAAGLVPLAPGSDGGGSVRIPAALCGLVGHKPTRGLVPNPHARMETLGLSVIGPLARSVDDAAALLDLLTGRAHLPTSFLAAARRRPGRLRVGFTVQNPVVTTDEAVAVAVARVAATLADLGHDVEEGAVMDGAVAEFLPMFEFLAARTPVISERALQPISRWLRERGRRVSEDDAVAARELFTSRARAWFRDVDVWVTPTVATPPPEVRSTRGLPPDEAFARHARLGAFTAALNASGQPAVSIPVRVEGHPWPVGVQLAGRHGDDGRLLALARAVLEARGTSVAPTAPAPR